MLVHISLRKINTTLDSWTQTQENPRQVLEECLCYHCCRQWVIYLSLSYICRQGIHKDTFIWSYVLHLLWSAMHSFCRSGSIFLPRYEKQVTSGSRVHRRHKWLRYEKDYVKDKKLVPQNEPLFIPLSQESFLGIQVVPSQTSGMVGGGMMVPATAPVESEPGQLEPRRYLKW